MEHAWTHQRGACHAKESQQYRNLRPDQRVRSCVEEAIVVAEAADRLARRGQAEKALRLLMDVEGPTHQVLDLFRTALKVRQTLLPDPQ